MLFARRETKDPLKELRQRAEHWRQDDVLRVTQRRRWDADPAARSMVIRRRDIGELALTPMRWGLRPDWQRDDSEGRPLINVRAETIAESVEWRRLLNTRRCLVPVDQFFEWKRDGDVKLREYAFRLRSRRKMMVAALWSRLPAGSGDCFAYISCPANRVVSLIHERMPVILDDRAASQWFNPDASLETLLNLLKPCEWAALDVHPVGQSERVKPYQPSLFASRAA